MLFEPPSTHPIIPSRWLSDKRVYNQLTSGQLQQQQGGAAGYSSSSSGSLYSWTRIKQLVQLPRDYSELINSVSQFPCPASSGDDSRTPTMCLVCGTMLCSQVTRLSRFIEY